MSGHAYFGRDPRRRDGFSDGNRICSAAVRLRSLLRRSGNVPNESLRRCFSRHAGYKTPAWKIPINGLPLLLALLPVDAAAKNVRSPFTQYAVVVSGHHGVYLGDGLVITASHVAVAQPTVEMAGRTMPAEELKRGDGDVDLALLSVRQHLPKWLSYPKLNLCTEDFRAGEALSMVLPEGALASKVLSPFDLRVPVPARMQKDLISFLPGVDSGTPVFSLNQGCLAGIISHKLTETRIATSNGHQVVERHDVAFYFQPASEIRSLLSAIER
jgi:hypothetical protein